MLDFKKANFAAIKSQLNAVDWDLELHYDAIENFFTNKLYKLITKHIPVSQDLP